MTALLIAGALWAQLCGVGLRPAWGFHVRPIPGGGVSIMIEFYDPPLPACEADDPDTCG